MHVEFGEPERFYRRVSWEYATAHYKNETGAIVIPKGVVVVMEPLTVVEGVRLVEVGAAGRS